MYDNSEYYPAYKRLKDYIADCINGDVVHYDTDHIAEQVQDAYDNGELSSTQYDDLMRYVEDM